MLIKNVRLTVLLLFISIVSFGQDLSHVRGKFKFLENKGQWPSHVNFKADVPGGNIWLEQSRIIYHFYQKEDFHSHLGEQKPHFGLDIKEHLIYAKFIGANEQTEIETNLKSTEYYNFFIGNDQEKWARNVHAYHEIAYKELYPSVDLRFYEKEGQLKYEYVLDAGADPSQIKLKYFGAKDVKNNKEGGLTIKGALGEIIEERPYAFQIKNGRIVEVSCNFRVNKNDEVTFDLGVYDESIPLVIDPILVFATYSGSVTDNFGMTATYAYDGKAYSAGMVFGNAYPAPAPAWNDTPNITVASTGVATTDAFVSKYSEDGSTMLWTNFVGGGDNTQGTETVHSLICDTSNNIYMYGVTSSTDFPTLNAVQGTHGGGTPVVFNSTGTNFGTQGTDIYTVKISSDGLNLLGATYIGGSGNDGLNYLVTSGNYGSAAAYDSLTSNYGDQFRGEIMLDSMNNILIATNTRSTDFPTVNPIQGANGGQQDGVVFKLSADFSTLLWSTYYGGSENDACYSVKIDSSYNVIIAGGTSSSDLPGTVGGLTPAYQGGKCDGFVAKLAPDGQSLTQSTYIGTNNYDQTFFLEVDRWDNIYIVGQTDGSMPIINAAYAIPNSGQYITKLTPDLGSIVYSTLFGNGDGNKDISPSAFLVDVCGNVYVSGWGENILQTTNQLDGMPVTTDAFQNVPPDGFDFYLFVLERDAQDILYGSYLGDANAGEHVDGGTSRFDKFGIVYQSVCGGCGGNDTFPTTDGAWSNDNLSSNCNNLIFKFDFELIPDADFELSSTEGCAPFNIILDNESNDTINSVWTFPPEAIVVNGGVNPELLFNDPGTYEIIISITDTICNLVDTAKKIVTVYEELDLEIMANDTVICSSLVTDIVANSNGSAVNFTWSDNPDFTNIIASGPADSVITVNPQVTTTYYVSASNGWPDCDLLDSVTYTFVDGAMELTGSDTMCLGDTLVLEAHNLINSVSIDYSWSPTNSILVYGPGDSTVSVSPDSSQYYYLTGVTNLGCTIIDSIWINVNYINPAEVYATASPDTIPENGTTTLEAYPNIAGYEYVWIPSTDLSSPTGQTVQASPDEDATYEVTIFGDGCVVKTPVNVTIQEFICGDIYIFIPSAFTPNGDGQNDVLFVRGQFLTEINLKIFNRWGELVFETTDQSIGWDGTYKGEPVDPDVFKYHLTAICYDGQESLIKGNISLLK